ncbi:hypothetical protein DL240_18365 [Lujinxingia litoralis]|uniref:DUF427 domain-containing protein n=1 Tax=Lujinxingia litoralis TaxID=2211119 RepID=A0A328C194_9DELT|nr:DUF427 domain-containing protein [Lujinxingia litoralis]RAL20183.1 hypothetical protein DL240_18365 [Lujinxingia litoralis]
MSLHTSPSQESIWEYPTPPALEPNRRHIRVLVGRTAVADSTRTLRLVHTGHPPHYYIPPEDVRLDLLQSSSHCSFCEWKGVATYFDLRLGSTLIEAAAWTYLRPPRNFQALRDYIAFFPHKVDRCLVDHMSVSPEAQPERGGWITPDLVGPFR